MLCKISALNNFAKSKEKHLCRILFVNKVVGDAWNFIKKETDSNTDRLSQTFLQNTSRRLLHGMSLYFPYR